VPDFGEPAPVFDDPWTGLEVGPALPDAAALAEIAPPAPLEVPPPAAAAEVAAAAAPASEGATTTPPAPEGAADPAPEGAGGAPPMGGAEAGAIAAVADPSAAPGDAAAQPPATAEAAPAASPPGPPLADAELIDAQVFTLEETPLGLLQDLIVDPGKGTVLGAILQPPEPEAKPRYLSTAGLTRRTGGGGLVTNAGGGSTSDVAELFAAEDIVPIKGEVTAIDTETNGTEGSALLKVRDQENLLHRIRIPAPDLVLGQFRNVAPGSGIVAEGAATRDSEGKVWIASTLSIGDQAVQIRDASGALLWKELSAKMLPARGLVGRQVVFNEAAHTIAGWTLSADGKQIESFTLRSDAGTVVAPWGSVSLTGEPR
jgi:hypothetical protein